MLASYAVLLDLTPLATGKYVLLISPRTRRRAREELAARLPTAALVEGDLNLFFKRLNFSGSMMTQYQFLRTYLIYFIAKVSSKLHTVVK